jgi:hypothetical protein
MNQETENRSAAPALEVYYVEMAATQAKHVEELEARMNEAPSNDLRDELDRQADKLRFYQNAANGNPRVRAVVAANAAKKSALGKGIILPF